jgi:F-type H+-transporting ATPase subunit delta
MSDAITVARPYAQAAFSQAQKQGTLKDWSEMLIAMSEISMHPDMKAAIGSPKVKTALMANLLMEILGGNKINQEISNFIGLLADNHRLDVLPQVVAMFEALRAEAEQRVEVVITTAFDLNDSQKQKIIAALKSRMGREINLSCETSRELLGGIIVRAGDKVIDGSARTRLAELANALA